MTTSSTSEKFPSFVYAWQTNRGNIRQHNEDNCVILDTPNGLLCIVCDGMGGHLGGGSASKIAVTTIGNFLSKPFSLGELTEALNQAFAQAHAAIIYEAQKNSLLAGMGTTCVALLLHPDATFVAHVGDSRLYFLRNNKLSRLTKDHSFVQSLVDDGIITEVEAQYHPKRNFIERALGSDTAQAEINNLGSVIQSLRKGDIFLLCTDGLSNDLSDVEIESYLQNETLTIEEKTERLMEKALKVGGGDNISIQIIEKIT